MIKSSKELVSQSIYTKLRSEIISGRLKPGDRLVELEIAKLFNASQAPVREAFNRLQEQGLLKIVKHTGTFVTEISLEDMEVLFQLRSVVEKNAIQKAQYVMNKKNQNNLIQIVSKMKEAAKSDNLDKLTELDVEFHRTIVHLSGSEIFLRIWDVLDGQIRRFLMITHPKFFDNLIDVVATHEYLIDLIIEGDSHEVQKAFQNHIISIMTKIEELKQ